MAHITLLTGAPGTGKSTAITKTIKLLGNKTCGGVTAGQITKNGERTGFFVRSLTGNQAVLASVFSPSPHRVSRYGVEVQNLEDIALPAIRCSLKENPVTIIDEIGPMQMMSDHYKDLLTAVLHSGATVIGTVALASHPFIGTVALASHPFIDSYKNSPGIRVLSLTPENRHWLPAQLAYNTALALGSVITPDPVFAGKIKKSKGYFSQHSRFIQSTQGLTLHSQHDVRQITFSPQNGYTCSCPYYAQVGICSHIMAAQQLVKAGAFKNLPAQWRWAGAPLTPFVVKPVGIL